MPQYPARPHKTLYKMNHFSLGRQTSSYGIKKPKGAAGNRQQNITVPPPMPGRGLEIKRRKTKILLQPCNSRFLKLSHQVAGKERGPSTSNGPQEGASNSLPICSVPTARVWKFFRNSSLSRKHFQSLD